MGYECVVLARNNRETSQLQIQGNLMEFSYQTIHTLFWQFGCPPMEDFHECVVTTAEEAIQQYYRQVFHETPERVQCSATLRLSFLSIIKSSYHDFPSSPW